MKTYFHGSPNGSIEILEPRLDPRLGISGVFVADEQFGPEIFSLLKDRPNSVIKYVVEDGMFIKGGIFSPSDLNDSGWLYKIQPEDVDVKERAPGRYYITVAIKPIEKTLVKKEEILSRGWRIFTSLDEFKNSDLGYLLENKS